MVYISAAQRVGKKVAFLSNAYYYVTTSVMSCLCALCSFFLECLRDLPEFSYSSSGVTLLSASCSLLLAFYLSPLYFRLYCGVVFVFSQQVMLYGSSPLLIETSGMMAELYSVKHMDRRKS